MAAKKGDLSEKEKKLIDFINEGKSEEVKVLLKEKDVRIDCLDQSGMTPLQHAAYRGSDELCRLFLAHGSDVNSNYHDHGYSALIFGALSGKVETVKVLLQAGAKVHHTNSVGRTASQMAAFVGQHQVVSIMNNFFSREDLEYYSKINGLETEPKLPVHLVGPLYLLINNSNLHPVKITMHLQRNPDLLAECYKVCKVLDLLVEKMMKSRETNEVMAMKFHYLTIIIRALEKSRLQNDGKFDPWIKMMLRGREPDGFPENQEKLLRSTLKDFPYTDSQLLHQMVRSLTDVKIGDSPTALNILTQGINGQRFGSEDDRYCGTCNELNAEKKCSACKMVDYCNQNCQKLHWFTHKKFCKYLAGEYARIQEQKKLMEEQQKMEEEEKARRAAEENESKEEKDEQNKEEGGKETVNKSSGDSADSVCDQEENGIAEKLEKMPTDVTEPGNIAEIEEEAGKVISSSDINVSIKPDL